MSLSATGFLVIAGYFVIPSVVDNGIGVCRRMYCRSNDTEGVYLVHVLVRKGISRASKRNFQARERRVKQILASSGRFTSELSRERSEDKSGWIEDEAKRGLRSGGRSKLVGPAKTG